MAARRRLSDSPVLITHGRLSESPIMVALGASPVRGGMGESPLERQFIRMAMTDCKFECEHFQRSCALVTPCCNNKYRCKVCHDAKEDHTLDPKLVTQLFCLLCEKVQQVQRYCGFCGEIFGKAYSCLECRMYDDVDKMQFHCHDCGKCRVGGKANFFHCKKCNLCLSVLVRDTHACVGETRQFCPFCLRDVHASAHILEVSNCGHVLHKECFDAVKATGLPVCIVCLNRAS